MSTLPLLELRSRWEAALAEGRDLSATELCQDCPEHTAHLETVLLQWRVLRAATGSLPTLPEETLVGQSTPASASDTFKRAATVPGFEILRVLGRGGMGVVYEARQVSLNRVVALKMILAGYHAGDEEQRRFLVEAEAVAAIAHPGIVQVYEYGTLNDLPYLAMEYCPGGSLNDRLHQRAMTPRESAHLLLALAQAMHAAHARGIVHRDLKPANVLLADLLPKVTDFGLAKRVEGDSNLTQSGAILGTPSYMAPEQATGRRNIGPAADIWALGVILYECLAGRVPFRGESPIETIQQVVHNEPVPPRQISRRVPYDLQTICLKCLRKEPDKRYASAAELADDLQRYLEGRVILARPVGAVERFAKWVRRQPGIAALAALVVLSLIIGAVVSSLALREARAGQRAAESALAELETSLAHLASGLIRPLGQQGGDELNDFELAALEELAQLPRNRDRVRMLFIDNALNDPIAAAQLERRLEPAVRAAVGLDEGRRRAMIARLLPRLTDEKTPATGRLAAAGLLARLGETNKEALLLLTEAALVPGQNARRERSQRHLDTACALADAGAASAAAEMIVARLKDAPTSADVEVLSLVLDRVTKKLPAKSATSLASRAMPVVLERLKQVRDPSAWRDVYAFQSVAALLAPEDAGRLVDQLAALLAKEKEPYAVEAVAEAFSMAGAQASPEKAAKAAEAIADVAIARLGESPRSTPLGKAVAFVAPFLPPDAAKRLGDRLGLSLERLSGTESMRAAVQMMRALVVRMAPADVPPLADAIVKLAGRARAQEVLLDAVDAVTALHERIPPADRARLIGALATRLRSRVTEATQLVLLEPLSSRIVAAARVDRAAAMPAVVALTSRIIREVPKLNKEECVLMAVSLEQAVLALDEKASAAFLPLLAAEVSKESTAGELWVLASGFGPIAGRFREDAVAPVRDSLLGAMKRIASTETRPDFQLRLARAVAAMSYSLDAKQAGDVAELLASRVVAAAGRQKHRGLIESATILTTLRPMLEVKAREKYAQPIAEAIAAQAATASAHELGELALAYQSVMSQHKRGQRLEGAARLAARAEELFDRSPRLEEQLALGEAYHHIGQWVEASSVEQASWRASLAVIRSCARQAARPGTADQIQMPLEELNDEQLIELLKQPACFGEAEEAVRRKLSQRHRRGFADVWQVAQWAERTALRDVLRRPVTIPVLVPRLHDEGGR